MKNNIKSIVAFVTVLFLILSMLIGCDQTSDILTIHMIDVGQGESILISTPNNKTILIDAGEVAQGRKVKSYLLKHGINKIDLLIGTHPHTDHIGGLSEIIDNFEIGEIIMPKKLHTSATFEKLLAAIESKKLTISAPKPNSIIEFDRDIKLHFLGPIRDYGDNLNLWSIVFRLDYKNKPFLFTGDMEYGAEMDLINTYNINDLSANVLNVGHHGSNSSTSQQFLDCVGPEIALISLGSNNPYNHPHEEVITRLEQSKVLIYRTDLQHTVVIYSDGESIWSYQAPVNQN